MTNTSKLRHLNFFGFPNQLENAIKRNLNAPKNLNALQKEIKVKKFCFYFNYTNGIDLDPRHINILILWEPKSVIPIQYKRSILDKFNIIIPIGAIRSSNIGTNYYVEHPYNFKNYKPNNYQTKKDVVMINANKFSAEAFSNYGLRRMVSKKLAKSELAYDLFGPDWNCNKFKEFRARWGAIKRSLQARNIPNLVESFSLLFRYYPEHAGLSLDKFQTLNKYQFTLIIENESDWITEKIYDAIIAESIPLYFGPSLQNYPKLKACAFELPKEKNKIAETIFAIVLSDKNSNQISKKFRKIKQLKKDKKFWKLLSYEHISNEISSYVISQLNSKV